MARDWRTTKTKTKREWSTLQGTPTKKTSSIPQPKCKKGIRLKYGAQQSENIGEKKPTVHPLTQGMTVPRHQSWSVSLHVSSEVAGGDWVGGIPPQRNAAPIFSLLFHVMFWPWALTVPWESRRMSGGDKLGPWSHWVKLPQCSNRWPPCCPSLALCSRHPTFHWGNEEHSSKLLP